MAFVGRRKHAKQMEREENVLWANRIEISVKKNCIYRSVGAYSCHEDNLTFNIHHNSAMRVHFD